MTVETPPAATRRCPPFGQAYFEHLQADLDAVLAEMPEDSHPAKRQLIGAILAKSKLTWGDLYALEEAILALLPELQLRRRAWLIRDKYRVTFGEDAYRAYLESRPPDATAGDLDLLRADLGQLVDEMHWKYAVTPLREGMRSTVVRTIGAAMLALLALIGVFLVASALTNAGGTHPNLGRGLSRFTLILTMVFMGAVGSFISLQQRIQLIPSSGDGIVNVLAIHNGRFSIFTAPIGGGIFALLAYLLFASGLLRGEFFPDFRPEGENVAVYHLFAVAELKQVGDLAKLLIWCFLAGFAERLIPDTLDRMIVRRVAVLTDRLPHVAEAIAQPTPPAAGTPAGPSPA